MIDSTQPQPTKMAVVRALILPVLAVSAGLLVFAMDLGQVTVDPTQKIETVSSMILSFSVLWLVTVLKRRMATWKARLRALAIISPLFIGVAVMAFSSGRELRYSTETQKLVATLQGHAREVKKIEEDFRKRRPIFTEPEDILTLEPQVAALRDHTDQIDKLLTAIGRHETPTAISQILSLLAKAMPLEKRQIQNIGEQIAVVKSVRDSGLPERAAAYKLRLIPLMRKEQEIEAEREKENLQQQIYDVPRKLGVK